MSRLSKPVFAALVLVAIAVAFVVGTRLPHIPLFANGWLGRGDPGANLFGPTRALPPDLNATGIDIAIFSVLDFAVSRIEMPKGAPVCVGVIGIPGVNYAEDGGPLADAPDIPEFMLTWMRKFRPDFVSIRSCLASWRNEHELELLPPYKESALLIVYYPEFVLGWTYKVGVMQLTPGLHNSVSVYLLKLGYDVAGVSDEAVYRSY